MTTHLHKQLVIVRLRIWDRGLETAYVRFRKENFAKRVVETNFEKPFFWGGERSYEKKIVPYLKKTFNKCFGWKEKLLFETKNFFFEKKSFFENIPYLIFFLSFSSGA